MIKIKSNASSTLALKKNKNIFFLVMGIVLSINPVFGQRRIMNSGPKEPIPIELNHVHEMVKNLADSIEVNYINGEKAAMLKDKLLMELEEGKYDSLTEKNALASHLSSTLQNWSNDKHFAITPAQQIQMMPRSYDHFADQNYFFDKLENLNGNIAYVKFNRFIPPQNAGSLAVSAMLFAANSNAVIIDLRDNMGGSPQMASMLAGFFLEKPTIIDVNENRATGKKQETWSTKIDLSINSANQKISTTDLEKLKSVPVYILTSDYTFSAAEMFSSALQGHNRATVIGETTGGGGHAIRPFEILEGFTAFIPFTRHYHPVTKQGWEAVGIKPNIPCAADEALKLAQITILQALQKKPNHDKNISEYLQDLLNN